MSHLPTTPAAPAVQVRLMFANDLPAVNLVGAASDPYAVMQVLRTKETHKSDFCLSTVNPTWYECFSFRNVQQSDVLSINVYDRNLVTQDVLIGSAFVSVGHGLSHTAAVMSQAEFEASLHTSLPPPYTSVPAPPPPPPPISPSSIPPPPSINSSILPSVIPQSYFPTPPTTPPRKPLHTSNQSSTSVPPVSNASHSEFPSLYPKPEEPQSFPPQSFTPQPPLPPQYHPSPPPSSHAPPYPTAPPGMVPNFSPPSSQPNNKPLIADARMQRKMAMTYAVAPRGTITLIFSPSWSSNLGAAVPAKQYKRYQINKYLEQINNRPKRTHPHSSIGSLGMHVGKFVKTGIERAKPLQIAINSVQPITSVFQEHSTYKISMFGVLDVFGTKRHGWNKNYAAAQRIFQGPTSVVSARIIKMQHAYLYGGAVKPLLHFREGLQEARGNIFDAKDLCELLNYGLSRGKPRLFTYVLMAERLYMAETSAKFFKDMMSKHAMHCSASPEVVYAGELQFMLPSYGSNDPSTTKLIIDNNSGTYSPGKEDLPRVAEVFRRNFPGLEVIALDFRDVQLRSFRNRLPPSN